MDLAIDKFYKNRFGKVTGSRCSPLVPIRSAEVGQKSLAMQLANEMYWQTYDEMETWQTEHGKYSENDAFNHWNQYKVSIGKIERGRWHEKGHIGGSTDAEAIDKTFGVDFKCPTSLNNWLKFLHKDLDKAYYDQAQLYMMLTGYPKWYVAAYLSENLKMCDQQIEYPVPESKRMIVKEVTPDMAWIKKFITFLPIVIDWRDQFYDNLKNHFE